MLYIAAIILGALAGLIHGGRIRNLMLFQIEKQFLIFLAVIIQITLHIMTSRGFVLMEIIYFAVSLVIFILLLLVFWYNRHYYGMIIAGVGMVCNSTVIISNGGKMPVNAEMLSKSGLMDAYTVLFSGTDAKHCPLGNNTRLALLADNICPPGILGFLNRIISPGDILIAIGLMVIIWEIISGIHIYKRNGVVKDVKAS